MTNKIYLSFNRLYRLQDGDYHGAKLSFKIKHGEKVIAEGEHVGKTLSKFISPIPIEETEITQPLTVEYVCTGNVEDVSVYPEFTFGDAQKKLDEIHKAITGSKAFQALSGECFINEAFISSDAAFSGGMMIGVNKDVEAIIFNALSFRSDDRRMKIPDEFSEQVRSLIEKDLRPSGLLWRALAR